MDEQSQGWVPVNQVCLFASHQLAASEIIYGNNQLCSSAERKKKLKKQKTKSRLSDFEMNILNKN